MSKIHEFCETVAAGNVPSEVRSQARRCLLDLIGVGIGGATTPLSMIIRDHAADIYPGKQSLAFDGRPVNAVGQALAMGMTIDALDGHDGYNLAKGHVGAGLLSGLIALGTDNDTSAEKFELALISGYEIGSRLAVALHTTSPDYHTSGAWVAVTVAAVGGRMIGLSGAQLDHAMGIAEYHGPRSQMMRCIDHPTMLKDGSGWGSMAGVSAVDLAKRGFTGAPALTASEPSEIWEDLGSRWLILEQYFKPYPVCRWAQPPVEAVLALKSKHGFDAKDVAKVDISTFHEATRLAVLDPKSTEEAQYSTAYPTAVALVRGGINADDLSQASLADPDIRQMANRIEMHEADHANENFPSDRLARVEVTLTDGRNLQSEWTRPKWDPSSPPTDLELAEKFLSLANGPMNQLRAQELLSLLTTRTPAPNTLLALLPTVNSG